MRATISSVCMCRLLLCFLRGLGGTEPAPQRRRWIAGAWCGPGDVSVGSDQHRRRVVRTCCEPLHLDDIDAAGPCGGDPIRAALPEVAARGEVADERAARG